MLDALEWRGLVLTGCFALVGSWSAEQRRPRMSVAGPVSLVSSMVGHTVELRRGHEAAGCGHEAATALIDSDCRTHCLLKRQSLGEKNP